MIQVQTRLKTADNSGAKKIMCLAIVGHSKKKYASVGEIISAVVKEAIPEGTVREDQIVRALIVRTKKEIRRVDGSYVRFDDNAAVIIDDKGNPVGTRVLGPIAREIKDLGYSKIASMTQEMV